MIHIDRLINTQKFIVKPGEKIRLKELKTSYDGGTLDKEQAVVLLEESRKKLAEIQDKLYAHNRYNVLIVLQAMDAAGKDSAIKHMMSGFNPQGVKVVSFKAPTEHELDHDYFWRHYISLPARGEMCIFNRSHYENVLITKVHPEYIMHERLPGVDAVSKINKTFWNKRYRQINRFEKNLVQNGTVILKFFLNLSREEQKKRFLERIDDPAKNWKFSLSDLRERGHWKEYQRAYEDAISATSKKHAPWFIIPADNKWYTRLVIAGIIYKQFEKLDLHYPRLNETRKEELQKARIQLMNEKE